jgi:hypothetical protein
MARMPDLRIAAYERPWMTALEMQAAARTAARQGAASPDKRLDIHRGMLQKAAAKLPYAVPHSWSSNIQRAVLSASQSIPSDTCLTADAIPDTSWWWLEDPIDLPADFAPGLEMSSDESKAVALLIYKGIGDDGSEAIAIVSFHSLTMNNGLKVPMPMATWNWRVGSSVASLTSILSAAKPQEATTLAHIDTVSRFILAALTWLQQKILLTGSGAVQRHSRKQIKREHDIDAQDVKVIQLRRAEHESGAIDERSIEWSCRWIVNGHWRNQPYKDGAHKLIYIMPYVKGPDDKPLKAPTPTVFAITR